MAVNTAIGVDIGGTGIKAALVDLDAGLLLGERKRVLTPKPARPEPVARALLGLLRDNGLAAPVIGAGFPAVVKAGVAHTAANIDSQWVGLDVAGLFGEVLGQSVFVVNDASAAGLAEMRFGAGKGYSGVVIMVTLGTGIGTGLFYNGVLIPNTELGHIEIRGKDAEDRAAASVREGKKMKFKDWAPAVEEYLKTLDRLLWPDLIIIGGGVSATPEKFFPFINVRPPMVAAKLGNDAGILGAALFAAENADPAPRRRKPV